ncbi:VWA domain-containing protein [Shimia abyssi]|uniref:Ca-activated chloride channel family protein n=1 Tax=Shimia abyssi TaxID=1662395 RepID=A0A2P8FJU8_9RHOB|nr:VWA domain-containing protein [Shimia abyssi]PSL21997.1 Ca-activated chloride channel family protein [Shimia abyssi]
MITLAMPAALALLPLPLLIHRFLPPKRTRSASLRVPFFRDLTTATGTTARSGAAVLSRSRLQMISAALIWALLVLSLATPERLGEPVEITKAGRDVVLAIDISGSMDTVDFPGPDDKNQQRLAAVRDVVAGFVETRDDGGDRMALIVFGSKAFVQAPLTTDLATVLALLDQTSVGMAGPHTALGDAIGLSIRTFEASEIDQRLLILLSDGNDTASAMSPINAAEIARDRGVEIYAIGVGSPDASGENRLDMALLTGLATRTGGQAFFAGDTNDLQEVYDRIDSLAPRDVETLSHRPRQNLAHIPLILAALIGLVALAWLHLSPASRRATP